MTGGAMTNMGVMFTVNDVGPAAVTAALPFIPHRMPLGA
jgi:hypothetical protein